jgi:hypothetical protein
MGTAVVGQTQRFAVTRSKQDLVDAAQFTQVGRCTSPRRECGTTRAIPVLPSAHDRVNLGYYAVPGTRVSCQASCNESGWSAARNTSVASAADWRLVQRIPHIGAIDAVRCSLGSGGKP